MLDANRIFLAIMASESGRLIEHAAASGIDMIPNGPLTKSSPLTGGGDDWPIGSSVFNH